MGKIIFDESQIEALSQEERAAQYQKDHPDAYPGYHR